MKCPICGCKMKEEFMCPYCKITGQQVKDASNKKAKERIKEKNIKEVYNSTYLPSDVNNTRLMLIALFGGIFGVHRFSVGKYKSGLFCTIATCFTMIFYVLSRILYPNNLILEYFCSFGYVLGAVVLFMWISDFFKIVFKSYSMPVVLGSVRFKKEDKK